MEDWLTGDTRGLGWLQFSVQSIEVIPSATIELTIEESRESSDTTVLWWVKQETVLATRTK